MSRILGYLGTLARTGGLLESKLISSIASPTNNPSTGAALAAATGILERGSGQLQSRLNRVFSLLPSLTDVQLLMAAPKRKVSSGVGVHASSALVNCNKYKHNL